MAKTPEEKREADRIRQQKYRARKKAHKQARGAETISLEIFKGTRNCINELMVAGEFEEQAELITLLLHGAHKLMLRDKSRFNDLITP
ncbi:hypothetical protein [uncultured Endozoicomonas sp.]|uniref:hypothetical protein n=1 Tax=uncultured Endozoicomonas sp. TaxID=432652 RepID=UPI00262B82F1|nr:hypothetical protein [uncultured Endozoicomonas sp.]